MGSFDRHLQTIEEGSSALKDAMLTADQAWRDRMRDSFQERTVDPLVQQARALVAELGSCAESVDAALRSLGRR